MSDNPYQAPTFTESAPVQYAHSSYQYRSLRVLAYLITILISLVCLCYVGMSVVQTFGEQMFPEFSNPNADVSSQMEMNLIYLSTGFALLSLPVYIGSVVVICMFMYRANANVRACGAVGLDFTPGWAGGWWFVPIMNLFKPYQAMKEIHQASHEPVDRAWRKHSTPVYLPAWWACWLIGGLLGQIETRLAWNGVDSGMMSLPLSWSSTMFAVFAAVLLFRIIWSATRNQEAWVAKVTGSATPAMDSAS